MTDLTLFVWRQETVDFTIETEEQRRLFHIERAKLVHGLVDTLGLEVKNWGHTDDVYPHEVVEVIIALGSAGAFTAIASIFRAWLDSKMIKDVDIAFPDGTKVKVGSTNQRDLKVIAREFGLATPSKSKTPRKPDASKRH